MARSDPSRGGSGSRPAHAPGRMMVLAAIGGPDMTRIIDASTNLAQWAKPLAQAGVSTVIRYYNLTNTPKHPSKGLTAAEADRLAAEGLALAAVFEQNGGVNGKIADLTTATGTRDANRALQMAQAVGQPNGSAIYFGVDHDYVSPADLASIAAYFAAIRAAVNGSFRVGVYGSGRVGRMVLQAVLGGQMPAGVCELT